MSDIIYHYTNLKALFEIIKTKSLLLTSLNSMNDPFEGNYSTEDFISDLDLDTFNFPEKTTTETKNFIKLLKESVENNKEKFIEYCNFTTEPYIFSFTKKSDNLSHWERYADNMKGVCISFDLKEIEKLNPPLFNDFQIRPILYKDYERRFEIFKTIVEFHNEVIKHIPENQKDNILQLCLKNSCTNLAGIYKWIIYFIKNEYWNDEGELRLLYDEESWKETLKFIRKMKDTSTVDLLEVYKENHKRLGYKSEFQMFTTIRPCKRLLLKDNWGNKLIPEIMIGSKSTQNINDLNRFLKANGLKNTIISESKIKIR